MAKSKSNYEQKKVNHLKILQAVFAVALILSGFFLIFYSGRDRLVGSSLFTDLPDSKTANSSQFLSDGQVQKVDSKPYKLYIPKLHKTLFISDGVIVNGRWMISDSGVSYLTTSPKPGTIGNSVLYGHNLDTILGKLPRLQNDDLIYVVMDDGTFNKYSIIERKEVKSNAVEILNNSKDARITIYTCSGFLDSARFVVVAKLVNS